MTPKATRDEYVCVLLKNGCQAIAEAMTRRWSVECLSWTKMEPSTTSLNASVRWPPRETLKARKALRKIIHRFHNYESNA